MVSWQKNVIVAVRFRDEKKHILEVKVLLDQGKNLGDPNILARQQVVSAIESGHKFVTAFKSEGVWKVGEDVRIVIYNGQKFIRTDSNSVGKDNLQNLPEF